MLRFLRWLWTGDGHKHEWEYYTQANITAFGKLKEQKIIYKCKVCGKFKRETICSVW